MAGRGRGEAAGGFFLLGECSGQAMNWSSPQLRVLVGPGAVLLVISAFFLVHPNLVLAVIGGTILVFGLVMVAIGIAAFRRPKPGSGMT